MRQSTYTVLSTATATSTTASDGKTLTPPKGTSAFLIGVETTDARLTLDGTDPAAGTGSLIFPKGQVPALVLVGSSQPVRIVSTASANSVVNITWLS